jgi:hypothetical protein
MNKMFLLCPVEALLEVGTGRSMKNGEVFSSIFSPMEVRISQEYSAYKRDARVPATARFIFEAATSSMAFVIFLVLFTLLMRLLISFVPCINSC